MSLHARTKHRIKKSIRKHRVGDPRLPCAAWIHLQGVRCGQPSNHSDPNTRDPLCPLHPTMVHPPRTLPVGPDIEDDEPRQVDSTSPA